MTTTAPRLLLLALLLLWGTGCRDPLDTVLPDYLAPNASATMALSAQPQLDIVVRMTGDATGFNVFDLMQVFVNGTDRVYDEGMVIGGDYAVYTVTDPGSATYAVTLNRRAGTFIDSVDWVTEPYAGPTITGVMPDTAKVGTQVTISGTGFDAAPLSVYFGGIEGTVDAFTATTITATVPGDAHPGLVWVRVGSLSAYGVIGFQPQDASGANLPLPTQIHINQLFPGTSATQAVIRVYGFNFDNTAFAAFAGQAASRILNVTTINVPPVGDMRMAFAVPNSSTPLGLVDFKLQDDGVDTNELPYTIE
jgi:hypothetical protein